ncbi:alpha/beta hydrolase [Alkanindiges illinoisensis]|uniref:alpha/beta hydrolase n=1 Tax=Alkanindiges illinoisensis TaxID=197183 RepID=UPI001B803898|nr:alpha/beta hydrolase [Alkanindiges illinoisensis]
MTDKLACNLQKHGLQKHDLQTKHGPQAKWLMVAGIVLLGCSSCSSLNTSHNTTSASSSSSQNHSSMASLTQFFSGVGFLNGITRKDFTAQYNIAYGQDSRQKLDVYQPLHVSNSKPRPVVLFAHGGSWEEGSKDDYLFVGESFTRAGYVTVVMNYRLAPAHKYPDYVQDTALAIQWINQNIARYGGNPQQIVVMGHSAGAFNVVEAVDNSRWLAEVNVPVSHIKAVVGIAGPYSYDFRTDSTRDAFPANASPDQVMPDRHVRVDAPPHLLLVGSKDQRVNPVNAQRMQAALQARQIPVQLQTVQGANHVSIMAAVASRLTWYKDTRQQILDYLAKTLNS